MTDFVLNTYSIIMDVFLLLIILIIIIENKQADFYLIFAVIEVHICCALVFLVGIRRSVAPMISLGLAVAGVAVFCGHWDSAGGGVDGAPLVITAIVMPVTSWVAAQLRRVVVPRFMEETLKSDTRLTMLMLDYARRASGAGDALLCWVASADARCYYVRSGDEDIDEPSSMSSFSAASDARLLEPMIFDVARRNAVRLDPASGRLSAAPTVPALKLLQDLKVAEGICVPLDISSETKPWLIVSRIPNLGWGHLPLVHAISKELAIAANWFEDTQDAKSDELRQLRRTVASDLHDSVAQSLAAAKFLLGALKAKMAQGSSEAAAIDEIREALEAEHLHVRSLILQLRKEDRDYNDVDLILDIRETCKLMKVRWDVNIILRDVNFRIIVPMWLSLEFQQIISEAVSNGVRHAGSSEFSISCRKALSTINFEIHNDNKIENHEYHGNFSPSSIFERVAAFGGTASMESSATHTILKIVVPLKRVLSPASGFDVAGDV